MVTQLIRKDHASTSKPSPTKVATATNQRIAEQVAKDFNTNEKKSVKATIEPNVVDDQSRKDKAGNQIPHQEIIIMVQDKAIIAKLKKDQDAIADRTATTDQKAYIAGIQEIIEKAAKKLNTQDTIVFGYEVDQTNTVLIAASMKSRNIIKPVSIAEP